MNDFQIQRLQERIGKVKTPITDEELTSLLTRLAAAEKGFEALEKSADLWNEYKVWIPRLVAAWEAWRKAAGK